MLHEDKSAGVWKERSMGVLTDYVFRQKAFSLRLHSKSAKDASERQKSEPVRICERDGRQWWWFKERFYWDDDRLEATDVEALVRQMDERKRARLDRAHAELRGETASVTRESISESVRHEVWRRDQGRCVECGSHENLEFDHIIPLSKGGSNTVRNIELRCSTCNKRKGASI